MADAFLQGQIAAAMARLVEVREDLMLATGTATRPGEVGQTPDLDEDTGQPVVPDGTEVYDGPCTIADPTSGLRGRTGTVLDQAAVPNARILRVPLDSPDLLPGDVFEVTADPLSPSLVGDTFVVLWEEERTFATYRRYVLRGSSWLSS